MQQCHPQWLDTISGREPGAQDRVLVPCRYDLVSTVDPEGDPREAQLCFNDNGRLLCACVRKKPQRLPEVSLPCGPAEAVASLCRSPWCGSEERVAQRFHAGKSSLTAPSPRKSPGHQHGNSAVLACQRRPKTGSGTNSVIGSAAEVVGSYHAAADGVVADGDAREQIYGHEIMLVRQPGIVM